MYKEDRSNMKVLKHLLGDNELKIRGPISLSPLLCEAFCLGVNEASVVGAWNIFEESMTESEVEKSLESVIEKNIHKWINEV